MFCKISSKQHPILTCVVSTRLQPNFWDKDLILWGCDISKTKFTKFTFFAPPYTVAAIKNVTLTKDENLYFN